MTMYLHTYIYIIIYVYNVLSLSVLLFEWVISDISSVCDGSFLGKYFCVVIMLEMHQVEYTYCHQHVHLTLYLPLCLSVSGWESKVKVNKRHIYSYSTEKKPTMFILKKKLWNFVCNNHISQYILAKENEQQLVK